MAAKKQTPATEPEIVDDVPDDLPDFLKVGLEGSAPPTDLVVPWDRKTIVKAFATDAATDALIDEVVKQAKQIVKGADMETAEGRALVRTTASKLTRSKTAFDGTGKDITDRLREVIDPIMTRRKKGRDRFTDEAKKLREPLTNWEAKEKARVDAHNAKIADFAHNHITEVDTSETIQKAITDLQALKIDATFEEFEEAARAARDKAVERLRGALIVAKGREDVERQREELAKREAEMEAERKRLAEEAARREAEAEAERKAREAEAEAERQKMREEARKELEAERAQRDAELAEARRAQAEAERRAKEAEERDAARKAEEERQAREQREAEEMAAAKAAAPEVQAETSVGPAVHDEPMPHEAEVEAREASGVVDSVGNEPMPEPAPKFTRAEKRAEAGRELGIRRQVYPKWVKQGRMMEDDAKRHIALMAAIFADYADD